MTSSNPAFENDSDGVAIGDLGGDGRKDFILSSSDENTITLFFNQHLK
jgi:hypothetical protein